MPLFKPESMHLRPGWPIENRLIDKEQLRYVLHLLAQKIEAIDLPDVFVECTPSPALFHPAQTKQGTPTQYIATSEQRAEMAQAGPPPSLFVTVVVARHEDITNVRRRITDFFQGTDLTIRLGRIQTAQNGDDDENDEHSAVFEITPYFNRHRTVR